MAWSAFNGVGLAFVLPCAQSLVADYYAPAVRGRAFGFVFTMAALGALLHACIYTRIQFSLLPMYVTSNCSQLGDFKSSNEIFSWAAS